MSLKNYFLAQINLFIILLKNVKKGDIVYVNTTIPIFAGFAAKAKNVKVIFHLHEFRESLNVVHRSLSSLRSLVCDYEIFVSNHLKQKEHIKGIKSSVVYNALSADFLEAAQGSFFAKKESFNVLMICSLKIYKGIYEFIEIAEALDGYENVTFSLVLGEDDNIVKNFIDNLQLPSNVSIFSKTRDTEVYYRNASILLNLSRPDEWVETFGLTILEGMAYGLPCIVPDVGGPTELVYNEINGYTISSYETQDIAKLIVKLQKDKKLYGRMSTESKSLSRNFSFKEFEKKIISIISTVSDTREL